MSTKKIKILIGKIAYFLKDLLIRVKMKISPLIKKQKKQSVTKTSDFEIHTIPYQININIHNPKKTKSFRFIPGKQPEYINTYFDNIYVINLKKRTDRLVEILQKLKKLNISAEIVEAVNGYESPHREEYEQYTKIPLGLKNAHPYELEQNRKMIISPGAWGCLKSIRLLVNDAKNSGYNRILIMEDDLVFIKHFHDEFRHFIDKIGNKKWRVLALGATQHVWKIPQCLFYPEKNLKEFNVDQSYYHPLRTDGSFALGVDCSVFDDIVREIDKMNCSVDSGAFRTVYKKYLGQSYVAQPNIVIANVSESDIGPGRSQENLAKKLKWDINKYDYPFRKELVSVIMPVYNAEKTIEIALKSLLRQKYKDIEIIVVDDGSTDNTPDIVRRVQKTDNRIIFKRCEKNRGCYFVRNDAVRLSKGKYIAINDADDVSLSARIETQILPILKDKAKFTIGRIIRSRCTVDELNTNDEDAMLKLVHSRRKLNKYGKYDYYDREILGLNTSMFSRELFEKHGLFWEEKFSSDMEIVERILYHETGILFPFKDKNLHTYLADIKSIPGLFELIDETLLISPKQDHNNLTHAFPIHGQERKNFEIRWRNKFLGQDNYRYPRLEQRQESQ